MKTIRHTLLALTLTSTGLTSMTAPSLAQTQAQGQTQAPSTITTGVMVILTVKAGVTREQVMTVMPDEIRQTVQLYLSGKVREWYSRSDGRGVILLLDAKDTSEAHAIMEGLPLSKLDIMDHDYIAVGPLLPLRLLVGKP
ncbi:hypothetical protein AAFG07_36005 [Bradyrhizobium sp. B097]|uniref:hypothetical protein n=1 Tax=Bradyrhizobium sp. B097 TaxID=3140244 RepID=UPI003183FE2D